MTIDNDNAAIRHITTRNGPAARSPSHEKNAYTMRAHFGYIFKTNGQMELACATWPWPWCVLHAPYAYNYNKPGFGYQLISNKHMLSMSS